MQYTESSPNMQKVLKGHGSEADFLGFLRKLVPHRSLALPFVAFGFEFTEIFIIEN